MTREKEVGDETCLLLYHRRSEDGPAEFVCFAHGGVAARPVPRNATLVEPEACEGPTQASRSALGAVQRYFGLPEGSIQVDPRFRACLKGADGPVEVYLARLTMREAPFEALDRRRARFLALAEARDLRPAERELLARVDQVITG
jgi:hypothetical protein